MSDQTTQGDNSPKLPETLDDQRAREQNTFGKEPSPGTHTGRENESGEGRQGGGARDISNNPNRG